MREYSRHIQMIEYVLSIQIGRKAAQCLCSNRADGLFKSAFKECGSFRHKLWDHLFLISDFTFGCGKPLILSQQEKHLKKA